LGNKEFIINLAIGGGQPNISQNILKDIRIFCPTLPEQTIIANFLDRKTTELDTLIANKKSLIELLKEERTAIINHAITKGISGLNHDSLDLLDSKDYENQENQSNPKNHGSDNVRYKDSGIEWIGEIPEHWEVKRLKSVSESVKTGSTPPTEDESYFKPEEIDWFGPADFGEFILKDAKRKISKLAIVENKCRLFPKNTILLIGIGATVGKVGIALKECASNQQINAIILKNEVSPFYCLYYLSLIRDIINMEASSSTLPIFNQTQTKNIIIPIPPISEQLEIANFIEIKTTEIDTIIYQTEKEIDLLKEYKTALISEVVLGKVDVRE
jgi:restriction endonuclease S subunit